ncbi:MAG TPA: DNA primase, partial [Chryseolinea sp.]|nr:DNA primase [Chryseolinea sp.]
GVSFKACCPLHGESTPSFYVHPGRNIFKCFGCGAGGDAIHFVMLHENLPFDEAVRLIARDHGIELVEKETTEKSPEEKSEELTMKDLMFKAQDLYRRSLDMPTVKYLMEQRRLTRETIIDWKLGVCLDWKSFTTTAVKEGYTLSEKCGLVKASDNNTLYDYFHHRITIPIENKRGEVVALGGRRLANEGAKYMNSPESPIYHKSQVLFGLSKAIKGFRDHGMAVLVEGYFDVIKLHQSGWDNTVATCGTALTEKHAKILRRYTDTVLVLRDGDAAGIAAMEKDIPILLAEQFNVFICILPPKEDPDSLFDCTEKMVNVLWDYQDGVEYLCGKYLTEGKLSAYNMSVAIKSTINLLSLMTSEIRVEQYVKSLAKKYGLKAADLSKPLDKAVKQRAQEKIRTMEEDSMFQDPLPDWVDKKRLDEDGFVQLAVSQDGYKAGIYFKNVNGGVYRTTNFTLRPLYHIYEQSNNRRLVEIFNCVRNAMVEMPTEAFGNQTHFENELLRRGNFRTEFQFQKQHFKRVTGWLMDTMPLAFELKTLGWQPEGFFAFSDAVYHGGNMLRYDDMGTIRVDDKFYLSLGRSKIHRDERLTDNPYENDLYLSYMQSNITFEKWASLFNTTYGSNAPYGIAFAFLTVFKDIVTRITKMPMLYCYGPKGSGKSAMAESLTWLFFSGKNGEGDLIKGFNLNPGQGTPFSFFNRVERFRNCPVLFNEFDENSIEDWKFGTFKAAYDGEGREVGDGDTGKKRKTRIQKIQGTVILVGQYISIRDDGSVLSRSITCPFSLDRLSNLTESQQQAHESLKTAEQHGLSSLLLELLKYRDEVKEKLPKVFLSEHQRLTIETRAIGERVEARLLNNYGLILAATKLLATFVKLPFSYEEVFKMAMRQVINHTKLLRDNSAINIFWKGVEFMFDQGVIVEGVDIKVSSRKEIALKVGSEIEKKKDIRCDVLLIRFSNVYAKYAKSYRERTGQVPPAEDTLALYMRDQPYYLGLCPAESFNDKRTSCLVFDYSQMNNMGIVLVKESLSKASGGGLDSPEIGRTGNGTATPAPVQLTVSKKNEDVPF